VALSTVVLAAALTVPGHDPAGVRADRCPKGMTFVPGGTFAMGAEAGDETRVDETPQHTVKVASFCLDTTEVTVAQYAACSSCTAAAAKIDVEGITSRAQSFWSRFCNSRRPDRQDHPANCVDWYQAQAYCEAQGRRLPTEEEWEYAARGPDGRAYPWGGDPPSAERLNGCGRECSELLTGLLQQLDSSKSWDSMYPGDDSFAATAPVGRFTAGASPWRLLDMAGNVWEWTASPYCPYDRPQCGDSRRVVRGGGWRTPDVTDVRVTRRVPGAPRARTHTIGIRCARSLAQPSAGAEAAER